MIPTHAPAAQAPEPVLDSLGDDAIADTGARASRTPHGWTPFNQALFLSLAAEGETVEHAAGCCGLSAASAYALRQRAAGQAFALGWDAARILARERLADLAFTRSVEGWEEVVTRTRCQDGGEDTITTTRRRIDNGLLSRQLARLDAGIGDTAPDAAARIVAREFDAFLDLIRCGAAPARIGLFLSAHGMGRLPSRLEPLVTLARADTMLRGGAGLAAEVDVADLDPARRAEWTADQWRRAEAAGLIALAPQSAGEEDAFEGQISQPDADNPHIWWDDDRHAWRTDYPPPADFDGFETGDFGDDDYERELSEAELAVIDEDLAEQAARRAAIESAERDAWFGFAGGLLAPEDEDNEAAEAVCEPADPPGGAQDGVRMLPPPRSG